MSTLPADPTETAADATESDADESESSEIGTYTEAVEAYLNAADWLTLADAPFKVHARNIAASLDKQLKSGGEVQSALASTFSRVLLMLDKRRPCPPPANPLTDATGPHGEASLFAPMDE